MLILVARLLELQVIRGSEFRNLAQSQHFGGVSLPARRGEIHATNSKTGENSILATNTTLDLVYVDPLITDDPHLVASTLADILHTTDQHAECIAGSETCPRELLSFYGDAFDPLQQVDRTLSGSTALYQPTTLVETQEEKDQKAQQEFQDVRRQFARDIEKRISEKRVRYVPLMYGATKLQMQQVDELDLDGVSISWDKRLIYADPEYIDQYRISSVSRLLAAALALDSSDLRRTLRSRQLRYVPIMHKLTPQMSLALREKKLQSIKATNTRKSEAPSREAANAIQDPLRSIALIPEHWRFYPEGHIASHVVGFLNNNQESQYGIERTYDPSLRGQEGRITAVSDRQGGQIATGQQTVVDAQDGDTVVLTIDRFIQEEVERILQESLEQFEADSAQAIVMDPESGRILAMANAPIFDSNNYGTVFEKELLSLGPRKQKDIVVELYEPENNSFVLRAYISDVFTASGRLLLSEEKQQELTELETLYDLKDLARYYNYIGENSRREIFPTGRDDLWLQYKNNLGVGAYLNRTIQEIYEPGSVFKPITMSIALDQGEVLPSDMYTDNDPVEVDEYTIRNALNVHYGEVTMTNCLEFSINTCMTSVSTKLGRKLFHRMIERFGFGAITGVELEDELPGEVLPWKKWSSALLATAAYGQGISSTPLQVVTAFSALANGGKLMRPMIVDQVIRNDGSIERSEPHVVDQVIRRETSETITAMLTSAVRAGFAKPAQVPGYRVAGKTGTSQIAGPGGKYETGTGSTITSFAGYGPSEDPQFVILVKFDRPRTVEYGSESGAPVFRRISEFLFRYYGITPTDV